MRIKMKDLNQLSAVTSSLECLTIVTIHKESITSDLEVFLILTAMLTFMLEIVDKFQFITKTRLFKYIENFTSKI